MLLEACSFEEEGRRGFVLAAEKWWLLEHHMVQARVAGLAYRKEAVQDPTFAPASRLLLRPEPENPCDFQTLAVWNEDSTLQAGYLPQVIRHWMNPWAGELSGLAIAEELDGERRVGLTILVSREPVALRIVEMEPVRVRRGVIRAFASRHYRRSGGTPRNTIGNLRR